MNKADYLQALTESSSPLGPREQSADHDALGTQSLARVFEARSQAQRRVRTRRWMFATIAAGAAIGAGGVTMTVMLASTRLSLVGTTPSAGARVSSQPVGGPNRAEGSAATGRANAPASRSAAPVSALSSPQPAVVTPTEPVRPPTARERRPDSSLAPRYATPAPKARTTPPTSASATAATPPTDVRPPRPERTASAIGGSTSSPRPVELTDTDHPSAAASPQASVPAAGSIATPRSPSSRVATVLRELSPLRLWSTVKPKLENLRWRERDPAPESETVQRP